MVDNSIPPLPARRGEGRTEGRNLRASQEFNGRLVGSVVLWAIGAWITITRHAKFGFGGDPDSAYKRTQVIHVDAHGLDAIVIGSIFLALGIINIALGMRSQRRIPVFWCGAGLLLATAVYGLARVFV